MQRAHPTPEEVERKNPGVQSTQADALAGAAEPSGQGLQSLAAGPEIVSLSHDVHTKDRGCPENLPAHQTQSTGTAQVATNLPGEQAAHILDSLLLVA